MGRWLDALKKLADTSDTTPQNPRNPVARGFEGFEGAVSSANENIPGLSKPLPDAEAYVEALRQIGPCGYGAVAAFLGWGATRAGKAETELRLAGRIAYDSTGRGRLRD